MAEVITRGTPAKYLLKCEHCESESLYEEHELSFFEDCYDTNCVEYRCPVCNKCTTIDERDLCNHSYDLDEKLRNGGRGALIFAGILVFGFIIVMLLMNH